MLPPPTMLMLLPFLLVNDEIAGQPLPKVPAEADGRASLASTRAENETDKKEWKSQQNEMRTRETKRARSRYMRLFSRHLPEPIVHHSTPCRRPGHVGGSNSRSRQDSETREFPVLVRASPRRLEKDEEDQRPC